MGNNGKLQMVVRSKKTLARKVGYDVSLRGSDGLYYVTRRTVKVYHYEYDEEQKRDIDEARELAERSGLELEVSDLTRQGLMKRIVGLALGRARPSAGRLGLKVELNTRAGKCQEGCEVVSVPVSRT